MDGNAIVLRCKHCSREHFNGPQMNKNRRYFMLHKKESSSYCCGCCNLCKPLASSTANNNIPKVAPRAGMVPPGGGAPVTSLVMPPAGGGGKRALICGVSYKEQKYKLKGTLPDVNNIKALLMSRYHFPQTSIRILAEDPSSDGMPTKKNMEEGLRWLVEGCKKGDSLVFYFSGHGLRQPDFENDEIDGFDETLCPVDFKSNGLILDNDINAMIVRPLVEGVTLHAIIDACHSGTVLDLQHVYNLRREKWEDNSPPSGANKSTSGGFAICLSACRDDQLAADTTAFTRKGMSGVMTHCFVEALKNKPKLTYFELLTSMNDRIYETYASRSFASKLMDKIRRRQFVQDTQLSSSKIFDVKSTLFDLSIATTINLAPQRGYYQDRV